MKAEGESARVEEQSRRNKAPASRPSEQDAMRAARSPAPSISALQRLQAGAGNAAVSRLLTQRAAAKKSIALPAAGPGVQPLASGEGGGAAPREGPRLRPGLGSTDAAPVQAVKPPPTADLTSVPGLRADRNLVPTTRSRAEAVGGDASLTHSRTHSADGRDVVQRGCECGGYCDECGPEGQEQGTNSVHADQPVQRFHGATADGAPPTQAAAVQRFDLNPLNWAKKLAEKAIGAIRQLGSSAWNTAKNLGTAAWEKAKSAGGGIWNAAKSAATSLGNTAKSLGTSAWNTAKGLGTSAWNTAKRLGTSAWNTAKSAGSSALNTAKSLGSRAWNTATALGSKIWNGAKALGGQAWGVLKGVGTTAFNGLKGLAQGALAKAAALGRGLTGFAKNLTSTLASSNLCKAVGSLMGQALSAISGAVRNTVNRAKQLGAAIWNRATSIGRAVATTAARWAGKAKQFATRALSGAYRTVKTAASTAWNTAKRLGAKAVSGARRAATAGWDAAKRLGTTAVNTAKAFGGKILGTARSVGATIANTAQAAGRTLVGMADKLTGGAASKVGGLANKILGKAGGLLAWVMGAAKSLASKAINTAKNLGAKALNAASSAASRAWQTAKQGATSALALATSAGTKAFTTAKNLGTRAWTTAKQLGTRAATTATSWAGKAWNTAKSLSGKAAGAIRGAAGTVWNVTKSAGTKVGGYAKGLGRGALAVAKKAGSGAVNVVTRVGSVAAKGVQGLAGAARKLCDFLTKFGPFLAGLKKLIADPSIITNAIRNAVAPMIEKVPDEARGAFSRATGQTLPEPGAAVQRHTAQRLVVQRQATTKDSAPAAQQSEGVWAGIWRHLGPKLEYLKDNWWDVLKQTGRQLLFPWEGMGKDLSELWAQIKKGWNAVKSLQFSTLIDAVIAGDQIIVGILGRWWGWFAIASVIIGAVIGAFFGGAGAIPGAAAGWEVAASAGEGLLIADVALQVASIAKGFYNIEIQHDTGQAQEHDLDQISNGGLSAGLMLALVLLSAAAVRFGKAIIGRVRGLRVEPPKVEGPKIEGPKTEAPKTEAPKTEAPKTDPEARAARLDELANDPDKGGPTPGSRVEAADALELEEAGQVKGPIRRANGKVNPRENGADFVDADGKLWDHKIARSGRSFEPKKFLDKIELNDIRNGEDIMLNHTGLTAPDRAALLAEIDARGLRGLFKFIPPV
jgi:phage-related protein